MFQNKIMALNAIALYLFLLTFTSASLVEEKVVDKVSIKVFSNFSFSGEEYTLTSEWKGKLDQTLTYPSSDELCGNIKSVCGVGAWIFYRSIRFEGLSELVNLKNGCVNLETTAGYVSSIRPIGGSPNYAEARFNLYGEVNYNALEISINDADDHVSKHHESIIIVSNSSWTIFQEKNFQGYSTCLVVPMDAYMQVLGIPDHQVAAYNISKTAISSVRKGCTGKEDRQVYVGVHAQLSVLVWWSIISIVGLVVVLGLLKIFWKNLVICCGRAFEACFTRCFYRVYYF